MKRVLFVCLGNICRSPLAEGIFRDEIEKRGWAQDYTIDSAGTGAWHAGNKPDPRSIAVAESHHVSLEGQSARQLTQADFFDFELILGMDENNVRDIKAVCPAGATAQIDLFMRYAIGENTNIADPYYGGDDGFETAYRIIRKGADSLATRLGGSRPAPKQ